MANELEQTLKEDILTAMSMDDSFINAGNKEKEEKSEEIITSIKRQIDEDFKIAELEGEENQLSRNNLLVDVAKKIKQKINTRGITSIIDSNGKINTELIIGIVKESKEKNKVEDKNIKKNYEAEQFTETNSILHNIEILKNMSNEEYNEFYKSLSREEKEELINSMIKEEKQEEFFEELDNSFDENEKEIFLKYLTQAYSKSINIEDKSMDLELMKEFLFNSLEQSGINVEDIKRFKTFLEEHIELLSQKPDKFIETMNKRVEEYRQKPVNENKDKESDERKNANQEQKYTKILDITSSKDIVKALIEVSDGEITEEEVVKFMDMFNNSIMNSKQEYNKFDFEDIKSGLEDAFKKNPEFAKCQEIFLQDEVIKKFIDHMENLSRISEDALYEFLDSIDPNQKMNVKEILELAKEELKKEEKPILDEEMDKTNKDHMDTTAVDEAEINRNNEEKDKQNSIPKETKTEQEPKKEETENKPQLPTVYKPSFLDRVKNFFKSIRTQGIRGAFAESFMAKEWQYQQEVPKQEQAPEPPKQNDEEHGQPKGKEEQSAQNLGGDSPQAGDAPKGTNEQVSKEPTETSVEPALNGDTPPVAQEPEQSQAGDVLTSEGTAEDGSKSTDESFVPNSTVVFNPDSINKGKIEAYKKTTQDQSIFEDYDILTGNINGKEFVLLQYKKSGPEAIVQKINVGGKTYNISDISGERNCIKDFNDGGGTLLLKSVPKEIDYISRKGSEKIAEKSKKDNGKENEPKEEGR